MKVKHWEKPKIGVLASAKRGKTGSSIRTGNAQYHLGPAPTPLPDYMGPAPSPFLKR